MSDPGPRLEGAVILADASAHWRVAGLRQLDRIALSLEEYAVAMKSSGPFSVCVRWLSHPPENEERFPRHPRLTHLSFTDDFARFAADRENAAAILVLNTRLVPERASLPALLESGSADEKALLPVLRGVELCTLRGETIAQDHATALAGRKWFYLHDQAEIPTAEKYLLLGTGKSQDGLISRYVNRPLSRLLSGWLVRTSILPNQLTVLLMALPLLGALFLLRGGYAGFVLGAILFQLHSALDGCDGELARVRYQDSAAGRKLDGLCDRFSTLLYAVALGIGLSRQAGIGEAMRWVYPLEGILAALLIGVSETLLSRVSLDEFSRSAGGAADRRFVEEERSHFNEGDQLKIWAIKNSGLLFLGKGAASLFAELTKRDVFNFGFLLLAVLGWPQLVLHILALCGGGIAFFAMRDLAALKQPGGRLVSPPETNEQ